jgi:hypothetical protein
MRSLGSRLLEVSEGFIIIVKEFTEQGDVLFSLLLLCSGN